MGGSGLLSGGLGVIREADVGGCNWRRGVGVCYWRRVMVDVTQGEVLMGIIGGGCAGGYYSRMVCGLVLMEA